MKANKITLSIFAGTAFTAVSPLALSADEAKASIDFRLRYEAVDQDNALRDADALTLRTRLSYKTATYNKFSGFVEFEDSRKVFGVDDYNDTAGNGAGYSVIADPETSELDQAYVQYADQGFTAKVGRQVITLDNHRFVGHVGWRQDRQTFDAASFNYKADKFEATYAYLNQRNRIFAENRDLDSKDHLLNVSYKTPYGKLTGYSYLLEVDEGVDNSLDTYGFRFAGAQKQGDNKLLYTIEFATQESEAAGTEFDADYTLLELGYVIKGITLKGGYEVLGSDDGAYGFSTPLATLHKFNGWADQFLGTPSVGLTDLYLSAAGKAFGGKWSVVYHDYEADDGNAVVDDLGDEINLSYGKSFNKTFSGGVKFAAYSAGDTGSGKVDTDKLWVWVGAKF
ncbi:hypothetical protein DXX93_09370 [Thalassotalea euphylliae]|uniref:Alginate export domain-containing protein n=1 Tax=Thalassotalea euphylliae TaxID=1655234 RepID=A0A3E0TS04_9GAMM|nr:alginate export family protein [Thalassotalea euphylliae]REL26762.1 hypothetical protein DXX93_09370 [Thalassotalea euphylliae]